MTYQPTGDSTDSATPLLPSLPLDIQLATMPETQAAYRDARRFWDDAMDVVMSRGDIFAQEPALFHALRSARFALQSAVEAGADEDTLRMLRAFRGMIWAQGSTLVQNANYPLSLAKSPEHAYEMFTYQASEELGNMLNAETLGDQFDHAHYLLQCLDLTRFALRASVEAGASDALISILTRQRDALWAAVAKLAEHAP